ncbi:hypothetical protein RA277_30505, partial [Pseudomonas syringae pv. tagetis]
MCAAKTRGAPKQDLLNEILDEVSPLLGQGKVADYIPALAVDRPDKLGNAV